MNILVLGGRGMAGHLIADFLRETTGWDVTSWGRDDFPVGTGTRWKERLGGLKEAKRPDTIINCIGVLKPAANADPVLAMRINALFPHELVRAAREIPARVIHLSTDCWKDLDVYGRSKRAGEIDDPGHLTLRTSILGPELKPDGSGLFHWFMTRRGTADGFAHHYWDGVTTLELARKIREILEEPPEPGGIREFRTASKISKYDLLACLRKTFGKSIDLRRKETGTVDKTNPDADLRCGIPLERQIESMKAWMVEHPSRYRQYLD